MTVTTTVKQYYSLMLIMIFSHPEVRPSLQALRNKLSNLEDGRGDHWPWAAWLTVNKKGMGRL